MSDLRTWQREALAAWESNRRRGIVAAATGTGKTRLAIEALRRTAADGARATVVVPTRVLQDQWLRELRSARIVPARRIGTIGGQAPDPNPDHLVLVAVIDSARTGSRNLIKHWNKLRLPTMLVVDECHWAGSEYNRGVFEGDALWRLGLSATPERGDDGFDEVLAPEMGGIIYRYSLKDAMDDGVLADLRLVNIVIDLPRSEVAEYDRLKTRIDSLESELRANNPGLFVHEDWTARVAQASKTDPVAKRLSNLVAERRRMLARSSGRYTMVKRLVDAGELAARRTIVFNETIEQAEHVAELIRGAGISVVVDHSKMSQRDRDTSHTLFRGKSVDCLVVVRAADEGLDVPDADQAIITSGTLNPRQRIQRLGRVVRLGGQQPRAISLLARGTPEEQIVAGRDLELLGLARVRTVSTSDGALPPLWDG
ncbi:DEAD/DEAH box helicase [Mycolicibacterium elephantis]|uniref:DEAD/DEAH box helicase n=1 Tax=Mycolicibacterium elephantis TaxID=81858 RepID=UPI0009ED74B0|nr:DEAD/DEAH box helicase [Mycolicibacterium elephantis]